MRQTPQPKGFLGAALALPALALPALSILSWAVLFTSLSAGRTTPATVSQGWLLTFAVTVCALLLWKLAFGFLLRAASSLPPSALFSRMAIPATPLLLTAPLVAAAYSSDQFFHYLVYNSIPQAIALWSPLLFMLAFQLSTLIWVASVQSQRMSWLQTPLSTPALIFAAFACLYIFTSGGHLYSPDEKLMYGVTASFADEALDAIGTQDTSGAENESGIRTSKYGLVSSLLALPPYLLSELVGWEREPPSAAFPIPDGSYPLVDLTVGPLFTAATCALLYLLARTLGFGALSSIVVTFAYGLSTSAWVYSKTFFSQPPATMFLLAAIYILLRGSGRPMRDAIMAGILLGLALGTRAELAVLAAPLLIIPFFSYPTRGLRQSLKAAVFLALAFLAVAAVTVGWYNYVKTGSVLMTGHGSQGTLAGFSSKPYIGIFGSLFSPGFGLFTFNPVALLGVLSIPLLAIKRQREAFLLAGLLTVAVLFYGSFEEWFGGFTWANRYLMVILPVAVLPVAALLERPWRNPMSLLVLSGALILGTLINVLAVLIDHNNGWLDLWEHRADIHQITWSPHFSPIGAHLRVLRDFLFTGSKLDLYIYYKLGVPSLVAFLLLFTGLATLAVRSALLSEDRSENSDEARANRAASISPPAAPTVLALDLVEE